MGEVPKESQADLSNLVYLGQKISVKLPSGKEVEIREHNGDDEGILSTVSGAMDGTAINQYLSNIITSPKTKPEDIMSWLVGDKYYLLLWSRIHSTGEELVFKHECRVASCKHEERYVENLSIFTNDFDKPQEGENRMQPYDLPKDSLHHELTLTSGKRIRFEYLTGIGEKRSLALPEDALNKNHSLIVRNPELYNNNKWEKIALFKAFSSKEMREMRVEVKRVDPELTMNVEVKCPKCSTTDYLSLLSIPDFFFQEEI